MLKIGLINMPFSDVRIPSIALTQIRSVVDELFPGKVNMEEFFFNIEMATFISPEVYEFISNGGASNDTGFGDWFFRQEAFPELEDNTREYFERYGLHFTEEVTYIYETVLQHKRAALGDFLEELIQRYKLDQYDIIGFTSMFMQNVPSFALARRIRLHNPHVTVVMGGANCESPMGEQIAKNVPCIDYVFSGTTLRSFPAFIQALLDGDKEKTKQINGIFCKENVSLPVTDKSGNVRMLLPVGEERPVQEVVTLNYDRFLDIYEKNFAGIWKEPYLLFETSRGCWWGAKAHCTFCGLNGSNMGYRAIPPPLALDYFNGLFSRYAHRTHHFSCVDNIIPKEYLTDVFPRLNVPKHVSMFYEVKADLSQDDMQILANAQILEIQPGIESLATPTLKLMRKGTTAFGNVRFLKNCIVYGIAPTWNLLIGFPGEQEETYAKYAREMPTLYHLPPPNGVFPVRFDRYSPYFTKAREYNLDLHPLDYYSLIYPYAPEVLAEMAYYFADHNYDAEYIRSTSRWINKLRPLVDEWIARWRSPGKEQVRPRLHIAIEDGQETICDSRSGYLMKYTVGTTGMAILNALNQHKNKTSLIDELKHIPATVIEKELENLFAKGLIFEEKGSMLNLVFDTDQAAFKIEAYHTTNIYQEEDEVTI